MTVSLRDILDDAIKYWEPRRLFYNLALVIVVVAWILLTNPEVFFGISLLLARPLFILAILANICYCAAYVIELPLQYSSYRDQWRRWRWTLWLTGTMLAAILASYSTAVAIFVVTQN